MNRPFTRLSTLKNKHANNAINKNNPLAVCEQYENILLRQSTLSRQDKFQYGDAIEKISTFLSNKLNTYRSQHTINDMWPKDKLSNPFKTYASKVNAIAYYVANSIIEAKQAPQIVIKRWQAVAMHALGQGDLSVVMAIQAGLLHQSVYPLLSDAMKKHPILLLDFNKIDNSNVIALVDRSKDTLLPINIAASRLTFFVEGNPNLQERIEIRGENNRVTEVSRLKCIVTELRKHPQLLSPKHANALTRMVTSFVGKQTATVFVRLLHETFRHQPVKRTASSPLDNIFDTFGHTLHSPDGQMDLDDIFYDNMTKRFPKDAETGIREIPGRHIKHPIKFSKAPLVNALKACRRILEHEIEKLPEQSLSSEEILKKEKALSKQLNQYESKIRQKTQALSKEQKQSVAPAKPPLLARLWRDLLNHLHRLLFPKAHTYQTLHEKLGPSQADMMRYDNDNLPPSVSIEAYLEETAATKTEIAAKLEPSEAPQIKPPEESHRHSLRLTS